MDYGASGGHNFTGPLRTEGMDRGEGLKSYVTSVAATPLAATEAIGITSDSVDFEVDRAYEVTLHYQGSGNTAADQVGFRLRRANLLGTSLWDSLRSHTLKAGGDFVNGHTQQIVYNNSGSLINAVIVGTVYRASGAGNVQWFANAANNTYIKIEDIGDVADYPNARAL